MVHTCSDLHSTRQDIVYTTGPSPSRVTVPIQPQLPSLYQVSAVQEALGL